MIDAYGIHLGPLYVRFYALILMSGMFAAAWLAYRRAPSHNLDKEQVWNGFLWAIVPGLIGARLYHVLTPSPASGLSLQYYLENPLQIFAIWNGGLGIYGAIIGGLIGVIIYGRMSKQPLLRWFDVIIPGVALAQAIGRWGNLVNRELYGAPTTLPWAVYIPLANRVPGYEQYETFHPLFLYESMWMVGTCLFLIWLDRHYRNSTVRLRPGDLFLVYLISYPTIRFLLDFLRLDSNSLGGPLTTAQIVSLVVGVGAAVVLFIRHRLPAPKVEKAQDSQPTEPPTVSA